MSASIRFLALVLVGWAGVRAATLGYMPGAELLGVEQSKAEPAPPGIARTEFPPLEAAAFDYGEAPPAPPARFASMPYPVPVYYRVPVPMPALAAATATAPQPASLTELLPIEAPVFYSPVPQLDSWPLADIARGSLPRRSAVTGDGQSVPAAILKPKLDRVQLTAWALLRGKPGPDSLAAGGTLGGSQAGARLTYNVTRWLAASLRTSSPVGVGVASGGEVAAGIRVQPVPSLPIAFTAERRQAVGRGSTARSDFALFAEGGLYQRPILWGFNLDAYAQGGVVGIRDRDLFADGGMTLTRPLFGRFSAGLGVWGGAQPGLYRVDAGPRLSMRVRKAMSVHLDWRQRMAGNAAPGSGPALTLGADF